MKTKTVIWGSLLIGIAVAAPAWASTFRVGTGTGCTHSTIQAAVDAANANPGLDDIVLTRSVNYTQQSIQIQQAQPLTISGGYPDCTATQPSGVFTTVNGSGGSANSVFIITTGNADILMERLIIRGGDETAATARGGGIEYSGRGSLSLSDITITANTSGYGGGISFIGNGGNAELLVLGNMQVIGNTALRDGGGIHVSGSATLRMSEPNSLIFNNDAAGTVFPYGYGGGLCVVAPASADIRSGGIGTGDSLGVISMNRARAGGGIAVLASQTSEVNTTVYVSSNDSSRALLIDSNFARVAGGAIYADGHSSGTVFGSNSETYVKLRNTNLIGNSAPVGAVAFLASNSSTGLTRSGEFEFNYSDFPCTATAKCNRIEGNFARNEAGQRTDGALIHGTDSANVYVTRAHVSDNLARSFLDINSGRFVTVRNTLVEGNDFAAAVFQFPGRQQNGAAQLNHVTVTDNVIGGPGVIANSYAVALNRSIVWQPGKTVRDTAASSGTFDGAYVAANETASIPNVANTYYPFPVGFMNPTLKDYRLRAGSPLVDNLAYDAALDGTLDVDGLPRAVKLPIAPLLPQDLAVDLGAYERQSIGNIMVNDSFNSDLSQWTLPIPSVVSRDADNGNGPSGSGSLKVLGTISGTSASVTVAKQCQVLPGPGLYKLT
ncbi:MAG: hypothetical protein ABIP56_08790, partial [Dokdonella sp.]